MAQQPLWYNKTLTLSKQEFLLVQVWTPTEVTLKHIRKTESGGDLTTVSVFKFPLSHARFVSAALLEAEKEVSLIVEIEKPVTELFQKFPRDKVEQVFERVKKSRIGRP